MATASPVSRGPQIAKSKKPPRDRTHWMYAAVIVALIGGVGLGPIAPPAPAGPQPTRGM